MITNNLNMLSHGIKDNKLTISNNTPGPSFKQKTVSLINSAIPYIIPASYFIGCGLAAGFITADIISREVLFDQGYGSFRCFNKTEIALDESKDKMFAVCITTSFISSILPALLFMQYNRSSS